MTGLIVLLILIPIVAFILLATILNRTSEQQKLTESLYDRIKHLSNEIAELTKEIKNLKQPIDIKKVVTEETPVQNVSPPPIIQPVIKEEVKPIIEIKKQETIIAIRKEEITVEI